MAMAGELILRDLDGHAVAQRAGDGFVNGTAVCKAAGKRWSDYWENKSTQEFVAALAADTGIPVSALVQVRKGGSGPQGSWVHPDLAIHVAYWANPTFAIRVNRWVKEIVLTGSVSLATTDDDVAALRSEIAEVRRELADARAARVLRSIFPVCTVLDRCRAYGWPSATKVHRRKIRREVTKRLFRQGDEPYPGIGDSDATLFANHQRPLLDEFVLKVWADSLKKEAKRGPSLFDNLPPDQQ